MSMDPALLSSAAGLGGALIGGGASLAVAVYTQRYQERLQRVAREVSKRETVYAEFMMNASNLLLNAYVQDQEKLRCRAMSSGSSGSSTACGSSLRRRLLARNS